MKNQHKTVQNNINISDNNQQKPTINTKTINKNKVKQIKINNQHKSILENHDT